MIYKHLKLKNMLNLIKKYINKFHKKKTIINTPIISERINKCFWCKFCKKEWMNCMKCKHPNANKKNFGRGIYCYPNSYDNCDCGGFEYRLY
jgi:hypothetical protein